MNIVIISNMYPFQSGAGILQSPGLQTCVGLGTQGVIYQSKAPSAVLFRCDIVSIGFCLMSRLFMLVDLTYNYINLL